MSTGYEFVVDPTTLVWTLAAVAIHVALVFSQLGLSLYLIASGVLNLFFPTLDSAWTRRLGAVAIVDAATSQIGGLRIALGTALLLPFTTGFPFAASLLASIGSVALLIFLERGIPEHVKPQGRIVRRMASVLAVVIGVFMIWEREDVLNQGVEILANAQSWRIHELEWQLANDITAPKIGEEAPDFELQDPSGQVVVRLSQFRGSRPVALIFGSYT